MHTRSWALRVVAGLGLAAPCHAEASQQQAWFVQDYGTKQWCAFVDEASAAKAADDGRFDWSESARLTYGDGQPVTLLVALQSEDAYVEDSYSFAADLSVSQVMRRGHYIDDPFLAVTYRPDEVGNLQITADAAEAVRAWEHETYFLEWPVHRSFAELPFASLVETQPQVTVSANC